MTNTCLSWQTHVSFVATKMILAQQPQEQCYPFLSVCAVFPCVQTVIWLPVFGIFNMSTDVDACNCAQSGCLDTISESALKVDSGRKIPCRSGDSNLHQYCIWLFSWTLYQLSYSLFLMCLSVWSWHGSRSHSLWCLSGVLYDVGMCVARLYHFWNSVPVANWNFVADAETKRRIRGSGLCRHVPQMAEKVVASYV